MKHIRIYVQDEKGRHLTPSIEIDVELLIKGLKSLKSEVAMGRALLNFASETLSPIEDIIISSVSEADGHNTCEVSSSNVQERCLVNHSDNKSCRKCSCGEWIHE